MTPGEYFHESGKYNLRFINTTKIANIKIVSKTNFDVRGCHYS